MLPTAPDAPHQNGLAEWPNQTLANLTRCVLHTASLGSEYWPFALIHSVYLKNRLPHQTTKQTPLLLYTGQQPSAKCLCIFGYRVIAARDLPN